MTTYADAERRQVVALLPLSDVPALLLKDRSSQNFASLRERIDRLQRDGLVKEIQIGPEVVLDRGELALEIRLAI